MNFLQAPLSVFLSAFSCDIKRYVSPSGGKICTRAHEIVVEDTVITTTAWLHVQSLFLDRCRDEN